MQIQNSRLRQDSRLRQGFGGQVGGQAKFKVQSFDRLRIDPERSRMGQSSSPGQVMLLSLLMLVGMMAAIMAVSAIVIHEMRMVRGTADAANAIAAADAGMECALFEHLVNKITYCGTIICRPRMGNGAHAEAQLLCPPAVTATTVRSVGFFGPEMHEVRRALEVRLE